MELDVVHAQVYPLVKLVLLVMRRVELHAVLVMLEVILKMLVILVPLAELDFIPMPLQALVDVNYLSFNPKLTLFLACGTGCDTCTSTTTCSSCLAMYKGTGTGCIACTGATYSLAGYTMCISKILLILLDF